MPESSRGEVIVAYFCHQLRTESLPFGRPDPKYCGGSEHMAMPGALYRESFELDSGDIRFLGSLVEQ